MNHLDTNSQIRILECDSSVCCELILRSRGTDTNSALCDFFYNFDSTSLRLFDLYTRTVKLFTG